MDTNDRLRIEQECRDLVVTLCHYSDHNEDEKSVALFVPNGIWIRGGKPYTGHAELLASFKRVSATTVTRHFTSNIRIEVTGDRTAEGITYYISYRHDPGTASPKLPFPLGVPFSLGEWHDSFVRTAEGWRFAHREVKRLFQDPAQS